MENIGNLTTGFENYFNDLRKAMDEAQKEPREYNKQSSYKYKPDEARYKLVVWFKDGNRRLFYSYDNIYYNKTKHIDENESLKKLLRLVHKYKGEYKNAIIYANLDPDRKIKENQFNIAIAWFKISGQQVINNAARFVVENQNNILNLKHLEVYSPKEMKNGN